MTPGGRRVRASSWTRSLTGPSETNGIGPVVWGSDGSQAGAIWQTVSWQDAVTDGTWPKLGMDGRAVFKWATSFIARAAKECLDQAGITPEELDVFIPHQANDRITDTLLRYLKLPEKVVVGVEEGRRKSDAAGIVVVDEDRALKIVGAAPVG